MHQAHLHQSLANMDHPRCAAKWMVDGLRCWRWCQRCLRHTACGVMPGGAEEARPAALPVLPEQDSHRVTGEEEERCVFSGGALLACSLSPAPFRALLCRR